jgi:hypothetical protein
MGKTMTQPLSPAWRFNQKHWAGYISGGDEHGIEVTSGADTAPVTRRMCMNVEHYFVADRTGLFVPRRHAPLHAASSDGNVRLRIEPHEDWRVETSVTYTLLDHVIEAEFSFSFEADYRDFHALVSNYFHQPTEPWLPLGGEWVQPKLNDLEHRTWARDSQSAQMEAAKMELTHQSGEVPQDMERPIDEQLYDHPVMVTPIGESGWSIVHAVEKEFCPSLSANRRWRAHDFSIIGKDVNAGDTVSCRAWMAYARLDHPQEALTLTRKWIGV